MVILGILTLTAIFAPLIAPYEPDQVLIGIENIKMRSGPCIHLLGCPADKPQHILGVDGNVRDLFSRLIYGSRVSLLIGLSTVGFAIIIGTLLGAIAGYASGWADNVIMRLMDVLLAFPALLLAIMLTAVQGQGVVTAMIAIGIASIPSFARVVRSGAIGVMKTEYVLAARAAGRRPWAIALRHVLPNVMNLVIVQASVSFAIAVLAEAALSYLGLGAPPGTPSWGRMLQEGQELLFVAPRLEVFPGVAIALAVLGFNLLGDGLRDRYDPRLRDGR
jgi:ABC-type dipeptide/oligopeptide/nickel transport system permease subunit